MKRTFIQNNHLSPTPPFGDWGLSSHSPGFLGLCLFVVFLLFGGNLMAQNDYGLNDIVASSSNPIYQSDGTCNGMLSSDQVQKVSPFAIGLKAGIRLPLGG